MFNVVIYGDDVLRKETEDISKVTPEIRKFIDEMFETMYAYEGLGLAAPQVGESISIAIIDPSLGEDESAKIILINPEIIETEGEQYEEEGCLSFPGLVARVKRPERIKVRFTTLDGDRAEIEGREIIARALSHEIDHLRGVLFIDHVKGLEKSMLMKRIKKLKDTEAWNKAS
jgi:peptide deformylase